MVVEEIQIIPIKPKDGLVGFASCVIDSCLYLGSMGIHKRLDGDGYRITYPTKKLGANQLNYFNPITREAGRAIEHAIIAKCIEIFEKSDEHNDRYDKTTNSG